MAFRDYRDLLRQMEHDMQRFAEEAFVGFYDQPGINRFWQPNADMHETDAGVLITMELAGVAAEDVHVNLSADGRKLTVRGVRADRDTQREHRCACHQLEIYFGPFERTFSLPVERMVDRDAITANLRDGFLVISLPFRKKQEPVSRNIPINTTTTSTS
jgi:HSP20 family molecular chaperone IbpA